MPQALLIPSRPDLLNCELTDIGTPLPSRRVCSTHREYLLRAKEFRDETFFEQPRALRQKHPRVYEQLKGFYGLDPATWTASKD